MGRFRGRVGVGDIHFVQYKIITSMENPHKTWKTSRVMTV